MVSWGTGGIDQGLTAYNHQPHQCAAWHPRVWVDLICYQQTHPRVWELNGWISVFFLSLVFTVHWNSKGSKDVFASYHLLLGVFFSWHLGVTCFDFQAASLVRALWVSAEAMESRLVYQNSFIGIAESTEPTKRATSAPPRYDSWILLGVFLSSNFEAEFQGHARDIFFLICMQFYIYDMQAIYTYV